MPAHTKPRRCSSLSVPALLLGCLAGAPVAFAQTAVTPGVSYEGAVEAETTVDYTIELDAGVFVLGLVEQESVDAVVTLYGPDGETIRSFDATAEGADRFYHATEGAGAYRFAVSGYEGDAGAFRFGLTRVEPVATEGAGRVDQALWFLDPEGPGLVVAAYRGGETVFARAYGKANLTYDIPFTVGTPSNLGSTSKQFTALAVALLDERGELSLDDDVREHIPELPDLGHAVTLRHLVHHTSGYREFLNAMAIAGVRFDAGDSIARSEIVDLIARQPELQNVPDAEWNYNNSGYALLTLVVERVSGVPFEEWMEREVFGPLGMKDSSFRASQSQIVEGHAAGYALGDGAYLEMRDLGGAMGPGGMYSTVADLGRWIAAFAGGDPVGPAMFEKITTTHTLADGEDTGYAMGLFVDEFGGLTRVQHGGANVAHRAMLQYFPEIDAGVVVLSNYAELDSMRAANDVARAFFADAFDEADADGGAQADADAVAEGEGFDPASYDPAWFEALAGRYELEVMPGFVMEFMEEDGAYFTQATGQPKIEITPVSRTRFEIEVVGAAIEFALDEEGVCDELTLFQNGEHRAVRLKDEAWSPDEAALGAFVGAYYSRELRTEYRVEAGEEGLVLRHHRYPDPIALTPMDDEDAFLAGFPIADLVFERDEEGRVVRFVAGNGRARGIVFQRLD